MCYKINIASIERSIKTILDSRRMNKNFEKKLLHKVSLEYNVLHSDMLNCAKSFLRDILNQDRYCS